jgi:hypothetical protein
LLFALLALLFRALRRVSFFKIAAHNRGRFACYG